MPASTKISPVGRVFNPIVPASGVTIDMTDYEAITFVVYAAAGNQVLTLTESTASDGTGEQNLAAIETLYKAPGVGGTWTEVTQTAAATYTHADATNDAVAFTVHANQLSDSYTHIELTSTVATNVAAYAHGLSHPSVPESLPAIAVPDLTDPGLAFIQDNATAYYTTTGLTASSQEIVDQLGSHANATIGSTAGSDTNDPIIHSDVSLPVFGFGEQDGNYIDEDTGRAYANSTSMSVTIDFGTEGLQLIGGFPQYGMSAGTSADRLVLVHHGSTRRFDAYYSESVSGDSASDVNNVNVPLGTRYVRATAEVGVGLYVEYSSDKVSWTSNTPVGTISSTTTSTWKLRLGHSPYSTSTGEADGQLVGVSSELAGTEVRRIDARDNTSGSQTSFTSTHGIGCTVNRSSTGNKVVYVPAGKPVIQSDGTDDYIQLPATLAPTFTATTGEHTVLICGRRFGASSGSSETWYSSESGSSNGLFLFLSSGTTVQARVGGTSNVTDAGSVTADGSVTTIGAVQDDGQIEAFTYPSLTGSPEDTTGVGTITHNSPRIMTRGHAVSLESTMDLFAVVIFDTAVAEADLVTVSDYLIAQAV